MPKSKPRASRKAPSARSKDAIALLKADHQEVSGWFGQFEKTKSDAKKSELAEKICMALRVHTQIEEEIFYPAYIEATEDEDLHHEAIVEHDGAKQLISQIEASGPQDEYFDAKVKVLSEMIKHHVKEEEQPGGMFAEARKSEMDLLTLGEQMRTRKKELMNGGGRAAGRSSSRSEIRQSAH
ncbi:MAG TPA: hemerythrin domain-containing protein [Steroidobacteraceae bacterium]|nr:hemerythrin domain-containing protein [Steroidobacteraceae bacterium]